MKFRDMFEIISGKSYAAGMYFTSSNSKHSQPMFLPSWVGEGKFAQQTIDYLKLLGVEIAHRIYDTKSEASLFFRVDANGFYFMITMEISSTLEFITSPFRFTYENQQIKFVGIPYDSDKAIDEVTKNVLQTSMNAYVNSVASGIEFALMSINS